MKVLLVEDSKELQALMEKLVSRLGHEIVVANNGVEAITAFRRCAPDLVFTDIRLPHMDGLALLRQIRDENPETIVVILTGSGCEAHAIQALRLGANNYLQKPVGIDELQGLLRKYGAVVKERETGREIQKLITHRELRMCVDNCVQRSTQVANCLVHEAGPLFDDQEKLDITLGLDELLTNAIEHGNLGITYEEKESALGSPSGLTELYERRLANENLAKRRVIVDFTADDAGCCEWIIRDEGEGFDWRKVPIPLEEDAGAFRKSGRGIFLSRMIFDELDYLNKGNVVRARKYVQPSKTG